ncbi:hypothetical protein GCM10017673_35190 [Streptosporangium violaceochromogenes]|nr:hypothetical protein GCM10017673_35190 [Streptosporangium violaceochromogenes]
MRVNIPLKIEEPVTDPRPPGIPRSLELRGPRSSKGSSRCPHTPHGAVKIRRRRPPRACYREWVFLQVADQ